MAYHLAGINRYTGGSRISVAQHCVMASRMAQKYYQGERHLAAKMLVHDTPEAFYGDASSPLKSLLPDYRRLEIEAELVFEDRFALHWTQDSLVKEIDKRIMLTERPLVFSRVIPWDSEWSMAEGLSPFPYEADFEPWSADEAELAWLCEFRNLLPWVEW